MLRILLVRMLLVLVMLVMVSVLLVRVLLVSVLLLMLLLVRVRRGILQLPRGHDQLTRSEHRTGKVSVIIDRM
jgi:hypothetical protein